MSHVRKPTSESFLSSDSSFLLMCILGDSRCSKFGSLVTHRGYLNGTADSQVWPDLAPAITTMWGMSVNESNSLASKSKQKHISKSPFQQCQFFKELEIVNVKSAEEWLIETCIYKASTIGKQYAIIQYKCGWTFPKTIT